MSASTIAVSNFQYLSLGSQACTWRLADVLVAVGPEHSGTSVLSPRQQSIVSSITRTMSQVRGAHDFNSQPAAPSTTGLWRNKISQIMAANQAARQPTTPKLMKLLRKPGAEPGIDVKKFKYTSHMEELRVRLLPSCCTTCWLRMGTARSCSGFVAQVER
jgi:hypothetical protein